MTFFIIFNFKLNENEGCVDEKMLQSFHNLYELWNYSENESKWTFIVKHEERKTCIKKKKWHGIFCSYIKKMLEIISGIIMGGKFKKKLWQKMVSKFSSVAPNDFLSQKLFIKV